MQSVNRLLSFVSILCILSLFAGASRAQSSPPDPTMDLSGFMNPMGIVNETQFSPLSLLTNSDVQKGLKLNKSQNEQIKKLQKEQNEFNKNQSSAEQGRTNEQMMDSMKQMRAMQADLNNKAKGLLTEEQKTRLGEIRLQAMGVKALSDTEIQMALGMTAEQKASVATLNKENMSAKMNARPSGLNMFNIMGFKKKMEAQDKEYQEKMARVLTADQSSLLKKMQGEPFKDLKKITGGQY